MAKTIEQLEKAILSDDFDEYTLDEYRAAVREDQRKIDIRKACDAFCKVCDTKECEEYGVCNWVYNFEKALKK